MDLTSLEDTIKEQLTDCKDAHFMLVDGISKLTTHKVELFHSSVFHVAGLKWKMIIHPSGENGTKDYLSFHLRITDKKSLPSNWEVKCKVRLSVICETGNICEPLSVHYNARKLIYGNHSFMSHEELKEMYLVNDEVAFGVEITDVKPNFPVTPLHRNMGTAERLKLTEVPRNESRYTWKMTKFSSFDRPRYSSHEFTVGPRKWKIVMFPKGELGEENSLSFYLHASDYVTDGAKEKTLAVYKTRVLDQLHSNHYEDTRSRMFRYDPDRSGYKFKYVFPLETLPSRGYLVKDEMYIGVEFLLLSTTENL